MHPEEEAARPSNFSESQVADLLFKGGYISLDPPQGEAAHPIKKPTWYKAEVEPCVGTSLFLEVPLQRFGQQTMMAKP